MEHGCNLLGNRVIRFAGINRPAGIRLAEP
jgi:hypothetical protein